MILAGNANGVPDEADLWTLLGRALCWTRRSWSWKRAKLPTPLSQFVDADREAGNPLAIRQ